MCRSSAYPSGLPTVAISALLALLAGAPGVAQESYDAQADLEPRVIERAEGEKRFLPNGTLMRLKVGPENGGSDYLFMGYDEIPPGAGIPRHRHEVDEEILVVHRGTVRFTLDEDTAVAEAGDAVFLPPGHWIAAENVGADTARIFFVFPRAAVERCFQHIGRGEGEVPAPETEAHLAEERRWCRMSY